MRRRFIVSSLNNFQNGLAQGVISGVQARGHWSNFCWPLSSDVVAEMGGVLDVQLRLRADDANWRMNVLFHANQAGATTSLLEVDLYPEGVIGNTSTGPRPERLADQLCEWLILHLLGPEKFERLHSAVRDVIPVGSGIAAPSNVPEFPANFGLIETDHPVLRVFEKRFRFEFTPPGAFSLKRFKTKGTGGLCDVGMTRCIVIEFLDTPPPTSGQVGLVFLDQSVNTGAAELPISP